MTGSLNNRNKRLATLALVAASACGFAPVALAAGPGTWSPTGALAQPRYAFTLTRLDTHRAIVAGGQSQVPVPHGYRTVNIATAEVYDVTTGTWSPVASLAHVRISHEAVQIADGRAMVAGGLDGTAYAPPLATVEIFDAATRAWSPGPSMGVGRYQFTLTRLADGRVLAAGGCNVYGCGSATAAAEVFDPAAGTWTPTGSMATPRAGHTATLLADGRVLVTSGDGLFWDSAELYDPTSGTWSDAGILNGGRSGHTATLLPSGLVLIAGGIDQFGAILGSADVGDAGGALWTPAPDMGDPRQYHALLTLDNGRALAIGGQRVVGHQFVDIARCETYDEGTGTWSATGGMTTPREEHRAVLMGNGQVLVTGGVDGATGLFTSKSELYTPEPGGRNYGETFDGTTEGAPLTAAGWQVIAGTSNPTTVADAFGVDDTRNIAKVTGLNDAGSKFTSAHVFIENDFLGSDSAAAGRGDALFYTSEFLAANGASSIDINGATASVDYSNGDASAAGPGLQFAFQLQSGQWFVYDATVPGNTTQAVTSGVMATIPLSSSSLFVPLAVAPASASADARLVPDPANRRTLSIAEMSGVVGVGIYSTPAPRDVSPTRVDNYKISNFTVGCVPGLVAGLRVTSLPGNVAHITWGSAARGSGHDVVRGSIGILAATYGDLSAAVQACLGNDLGANSIDDAALPGAGDGFFYLVRGTGCGAGSYDTASVGQVRSRDAGIAASGATCP